MKPKNIDSVQKELPYWRFPGAFEARCGEEMCNFRNQMEEFDQFGEEVVGISIDTPFAIQEFADQNDLNFRLASDTSKEISEQSGVKTVFPRDRTRNRR